MDLGLTGKRAIVTGGSQGVGLAIATALAGEGCNLALGARGKERLGQAARALSKSGVDVHEVQADFTREADCERFVEASAAALGGVDILINNVGGMTPGGIDTLTSDQWRELFDRNLMSYIWTTRYAIPHLRQSSMGRILNVSGLSGKQLMPGALSTTLPNAAINGFTKQMAAELAPDDITVNNLCPGTVDTENWGPRAQMLAEVKGTTPAAVREEMAGYALLNRWGRPEEIGDAAAFLVSAKNSFMTGTTVEVCGGWAKYF